VEHVEQGVYLLPGFLASGPLVSFSGGRGRASRDLQRGRKSPRWRHPDSPTATLGEEEFHRIPLTDNAFGDYQFPTGARNRHCRQGSDC
jgi:hypothetical protein